MNRSMRAFCLVLAITVCVGCERRRESTASKLGHNNNEYVIAIVFDLSGSFQELMNERAYKFALRVIDRYAKDRGRGQDRIILAQVSGPGTLPLLWEGTAHELRKRFKSSADFNAFLKSHANPSGSLINQGVAQAASYVLREPRVASGEVKSAMFVLSDMEDNDPEQAASQEKLRQTLTTYASKGNIAGFYFVDQRRLRALEKVCQDAGFRDFKIVCDIVDTPDLPSF